MVSNTKEGSDAIIGLRRGVHRATKYALFDNSLATILRPKILIFWKLIVRFSSDMYEIILSCC